MEAKPPYSLLHRREDVEREKPGQEKALMGVRLLPLSLDFVRQVRDGRHFLQTFLTTVDTSGKHRLSLMGLTQVSAVTLARRHPYWNPNPNRDQYLQVR
jgi:hypothetical protein